MRDSISDSHCHRDSDGNASSVSDTILSARDHSVIDTDDYDR